ncbi:uroporphyrinogen decarboxylase family protein [Chloroflexota bacterium]
MMTETNGLTSRQLIQRFFTQGTVPRAPFIPWIFTHAARLEQILVRQMFGDPNQYAMAIRNAQKLYGYDAIVNVFDPSLEAEACGCPVTWGGNYELPAVAAHPFCVSNRIPEVDIAAIEQKGRLPVVLEATRRMKTVMGRTMAIVGVVTGPLALATRLLGTDIIAEMDRNPEEAGRVLDFAGQVVAKVCRAYCELEPDIIAVADDLLLKVPSPHHAAAASPFGTFCSLARFYNAGSLLITAGGGSGDNLEILAGLDFDGVAVGNVSLASLKQANLRAGLVQGAAIPLPVLAANDEEMDRFVSELAETAGKTRFFFTTVAEVPAETAPERMHALIKTLASVGSDS